MSSQKQIFQVSFHNSPLLARRKLANGLTLTAFRMLKLFGRKSFKMSVITCKTLKRCMVGYGNFYVLINKVKLSLNDMEGPRCI